MKVNSHLRVYFALTTMSFAAALLLFCFVLQSPSTSTYLLFQMNVDTQQITKQPLIRNARGQPVKIAPWIASTRIRTTTERMKEAIEVEQKALVPHRSAKKKEVASTEAPQTVTEFEENLEATNSGETNDSTLQINAHNFSFVILEKDICAQRMGLFIAVVVHTAPQNHKRRMFIRETWGNVAMYERLRIVVVFAMGIKEGNDSDRVQMMIERESDTFRDIIQEDFIDTYRNLTYKSVMWLKWLDSYCTQPAFVLKIDDDVFVNSFNLIRHVSNMYRRRIGFPNTISCLVWHKVPVIRRENSKWFVKKEEYSKDVYDPYCSGSAYLMSTDLIPKLYNASLHTRFFWIDDFYITGELAAVVNASFNQFYSLYTVHGRNFIKHQENVISEYKIFAHLPDAKASEKYSLWRTVERDHGF